MPAQRPKIINWILARPAIATGVFTVAVSAAVALLKSAVSDACSSLPIPVIRLEVAFSTHHFLSLLAAERDCRSAAIAQLGGWDYLFAAVYPFLLISAFAWAVAWRMRPVRSGEAAPSADAAAAGERLLTRVILMALAAGFFDCIEDLCLSIAARSQSGASGVLIAIGSIAALSKWLLIGGWLALLVAEINAGPRGRVLRLTRFSALAVLLGGLPLLALAQGEDLLQRLAESASPFWYAISASFAIFFAALVAWYAARRLLMQPFDARSNEETSEHWEDWFGYFATQIPRFFGAVMLLLGGCAFARAGFAIPQFVGAVAITVATVFVLDWRFKTESGQRRLREGGGQSAGIAVRESLKLDGLRIRLVQMIASVVISALVICGPRLTSPLPLNESRLTVYALRVGAVACLTLAWFLFLLVRYRRNLLAARAHAHQRSLVDLEQTAFVLPRQTTVSGAHAPPLPMRPSNRVVVAAGAAASFASLMFLSFMSPEKARGIGPVWVLALFVANAVFIGSLTVFAYERTRFPLVRVATGFALLFGLWNENHPVRLFPRSTPGGTAQPDTRISIDSFYRKWTRQQRGPLVVVAAAGGGLRAAYWTAISLAALQDRAASFVGSTFAISGVSGGSVGAALFASIVHDTVASRIGSPCAGDTTELAVPNMPYSRCVRRFFRDDHLTPVLAKMVGPDFAQRFFPYPFPWSDRSLGLERSFEQSYASMYSDSAFGRSFEALAMRDSTREPALFLNSTSVESGKRYVQSTVRFDPWLNDTRDVLERLSSDIRVSTAAHNSARFTYVSPAGLLVSRDGAERGRIVDGGYFENSGLVTAREIVERLLNGGAAASFPRDSSTTAAPVIVLYLCNDPTTCHSPLPDSAAHSADSLAQAKPTFANELLSPVRALLSTRDARGELAASEVFHMGNEVRYFQLNVCGSLRLQDADSSKAKGDSSATVSAAGTRAREQAVSPPLGWSLSRLARRWMDASLLPGDTLNGVCPQANRRVLDSIAQLLATPAPLSRR
ncbi:MAG TPA: hypothetical protein VGM50_22810 [Gemmatimonadaceae bacterium]|jgi:hypothetical protein